MALDLNDKTSNGNNLTNVNTVADSNDTPFSGLNTDSASLTAASSMYLSANDSASLSVTSSFTIECWTKFASTPSNGANMDMVSKWQDSTNERAFQFELNNNSGLFLRLQISSNGTNVSGGVIAWTPSTSVWYHTACVYDATGPTVQFYVNGGTQGAAQSLSLSTIFDSTKKLLIGAYNPDASTSAYVDGKIDEVRLWAVARSAAQINANYNTQLNGNEANLNAYWPFNTPGVNTGFMTMKRGYW